MSRRGLWLCKAPCILADIAILVCNQHVHDVTLCIADYSGSALAVEHVPPLVSVLIMQTHALTNFDVHCDSSSPDWKLFAAVKLSQP